MTPDPSITLRRLERESHLAICHEAAQALRPLLQLAEDLAKPWGHLEPQDAKKRAIELAERSRRIVGPPAGMALEWAEPAATAPAPQPSSIAPVSALPRGPRLGLLRGII